MNVASQARKSNLPAPGSFPAGNQDRIRTSEQAQSKRMLVALALLLVAIGVVAYRDRQFLFEAGPERQQAATQPVVAQTATESPAVVESKSVAPSAKLANTATQDSAAQHTATQNTTTQKNSATDSATPAAEVAAQQKPAPKVEPAVKAPDISTTSKAPVAAQQHSNVSKSAAALTAQAAQRTRMPEVTVQQPGTALYPRLDQRTKVEGSVELQALVGTDGSIQELHVVRGPAVLGSAAREAVLQWKFKPFTQDGVAVETYARITVNFTIKVVDGSPKTVASVEPEHVIILADNFQR